MNSLSILAPAILLITQHPWALNIDEKLSEKKIRNNFNGFNEIPRIRSIYGMICVILRGKRFYMVCMYFLLPTMKLKFHMRSKRHQNCQTELTRHRRFMS